MAQGDLKLFAAMVSPDPNRNLITPTGNNAFSPDRSRTATCPLTVAKSSHQSQDGLKLASTEVITLVVTFPDEDTNPKHNVNQTSQDAMAMYTTHLYVYLKPPLKDQHIIFLTKFYIVIEDVAVEKLEECIQFPDAIDEQNR